MTWNAAVAAPDPNQFFTYRHDYDGADWMGYYDSAAVARENVIADFSHDLGVKYGDDPRQFLNIYYPELANSAVPTIVYFHGGYFKEGHPAYYDHLARPWVDAGAVFVCAGYRFLPDASVAESCDDAVRAVEWVKENIESYGGDSNQIIVAGHSAGGYLTAMVTLTDWGADFKTSGGKIIGALVMSAPSKLNEDQGDLSDPEFPHVLTRVTGEAPEQVLISFGDPEFLSARAPVDLFKEDGLALRDRLAQLDVSASIVSLPELDHVGTALAFGETTSPLFLASKNVVFGE